MRASTAAKIRFHIREARDASRMIVEIRQDGRHIPDAFSIRSNAADLVFWNNVKVQHMMAARLLKAEG
jgi:hypothetical protein